MLRSRAVRCEMLVAVPISLERENAPTEFKPHRGATYYFTNSYAPMGLVKIIFLYSVPISSERLPIFRT
jgi:hypothetical protein